MSREFCFKGRLWGFRLGPRDMPEPLLTMCTVPLICYDRLKMASIEAKRISPTCKPCVSVYQKYVYQGLRMYMWRTQRFACLYDMEVRCVSVL